MDKLPDTCDEAPITVAGLVEKAVSQTRLCIECKHLRKHAFLPATLRPCVRPGLPVNLINGRREFPAVVARGYDGLCGEQGKFWEKK